MGNAQKRLKKWNGAYNFAKGAMLVALPLSIISIVALLILATNGRGNFGYLSNYFFPIIAIVTSLLLIVSIPLLVVAPRKIDLASQDLLIDINQAIKKSDNFELPGHENTENSVQSIAGTDNDTGECQTRNLEDTEKTRELIVFSATETIYDLGKPEHLQTVLSLAQALPSNVEQQHAK